MEIMKPMPHDVEAEKQILGAILINNNSLGEVIEDLKADDFYLANHKHIYSAMVKLYKQQEGIDIVLIRRVLGDEIIKLITISYISSLSDGVLSHRNIKSHSRIVKECSERRKLIRALMDNLTRAYEEDSDIIKKELSNSLVTTNREVEQLDDIESIINKTFHHIESAYQTGGRITGLETGFKVFDKNSNGIKKKEVTIIAARPSMGKTAFTLNTIKNIASKHKTLLFELEMDTVSIGTRLLAAEGNVDGSKMQQGKLSEAEFTKVANASNNLLKKNILLDTRGAITWETIESTIKKTKLQRGLDIVYIDHIGIINIPNKDRNKELGEITARAKALSKELDIAIVFLCQLSRACEQRADHRPMLSDLRDSGAIEQDADLIIFLYRDEYYHKETEQKNIMEVSIAKNRNGIVGTIPLCYIAQYQKIGDLDYR